MPTTQQRFFRAADRHMSGLSISKKIALVRWQRERAVQLPEIVFGRTRISRGRGSPYLTESQSASKLQLKLLAGKWSDEIGIVFRGDRAKESVLPASASPSADFVPIKDIDRVGASDPMTALLVYIGGNGATTVLHACERTVESFDGHTRYNLRLTFERFGMAHANEGYQGQVAVCSAKSPGCRIRS